MKAGVLKKLLVGAGLLMLVALVVVALVNNKSVRIDYHLARLKDAQYESMPKLASAKESRYHRSLRWVRWVLAGRPNWEGAWEKEEDALIRIGYGDRRKYVLQKGELQVLAKVLRSGGLKEEWSIMGQEKITFFAAKEDFPFIEEKIRELESKRRDGVSPSR